MLPTMMIMGRTSENCKGATPIKCFFPPLVSLHRSRNPKTPSMMPIPSEKIFRITINKNNRQNSVSVTECSYTQDIYRHEFKGVFEDAEFMKTGS